MKLFISIVLLLSFNFLIAQSLSPNVISTAGGNFTGGNSSLDFTIGEPLTSTFSSSDNLLTQGFHQPNVYVTSIGETQNTKINVVVYPNPAVNVVEIQFTEIVSKTTVEVYTSDGKLFYSNNIILDSKAKINVVDWPSGTYHLKLTGSVSAHYQLVKLK